MTLAGTWAFAWATQNHVMPGLLWPYALGAILWGIAFAAVRLISDLLRGFHRYSLSSAIGGQRGGYAANAMLLCLTMAATAFFGMSLFMAVAIQIIVNLIFLGFGIWSLRSVSDWQTASLSDNAHQADFRNTFGEVVSRAWPLLILQLIAFGIPEFDTLLIGSFATPEEAALYRPARLLTMVVSVPLQLVNTTIQPFIAEFEAMRDRRRTTILVRGGAALAAIPSILLLLCFLLFPQTLLSAVFGAKFASAGLALQILSIGFAVFVLTGSCGMVLQMTGHERSAMTSSIACAALYLCTAPWLVSRYGLIGAAVSSASLQVISNIAATLLVYRHERIWTIASLSPAMVIDCCQLAFPRFANKRIAPARDPAANAAANN
jgi:O-antigen/teichoic acid export membrane protein